MVDVQRSGGVSRTDCYHFRFTHRTPYAYLWNLSPSTTQLSRKDFKMGYLIDLSDSFLEKISDGLFVCGGDLLNQMNIDRLESLSGWRSLVNLSTRGDSCLYDCFTNPSSLFDSCYPIHMSIKIDHEGVILPPALKLNPLRY